MEMLDTPSWRWGLSLIAFTMAIHSTVVVLMAFVGVRVRARLEKPRPKVVETCSRSLFRQAW